MFIVLDRDGVINYESEAYIKNPDEWIPIPGSLEAIARLKSQGHQVVVATNQSGIARGFFTHEMLQQIHEKMLQELRKLNASLDGVFYCPHHPDEHCSCRKPKPGMLLQIAEQFKIDLPKLICVGDSLRDIEAALAVNAQPILVLTGNGKFTRTRHELKGVEIYPDLAAVVNKLDL